MSSGLLKPAASAVTERWHRWDYLMPPPVSRLHFNDAAGASIRLRLTQEDKNSRLQKCLYWNAGCIFPESKQYKTGLTLATLGFFSFSILDSVTPETPLWSISTSRQSQNHLRTEPECRPEKASALDPIPPWNYNPKSIPSLDWEDKERGGGPRR